jgi:hypothetical protein
LDESIGGERRIFGGELVVTVLQAAAGGDGAVPHAPAVGVASSGGSVLVTTLLAAGVGGRIPFALVPLTAVRAVAEAAKTAAVSLDGIPLAGRAGVTVGLRANHEAGTAAGGTVDGVSLVPVALLIVGASSGVLGSGVGVDEVAVLALLFAGFVGSPFAHATTSLRAEGLRGLEGASDTALSSFTIPHAASVGVAAATVSVGRRAVVNTLVVDEGASGVSRAVELADGEVSDVVVTGARVAALVLTNVPLTFGLLVAIGFVVVAVRALVDALTLVELADFDDSASGVVGDLGALACADAAIVIPLATCVGRASTVGLEAEGTRAAAARESLEAPGSLRLFVAASSGGASVLIGVEAVGTAGLAFDDVDVASGESVGVPDTLGPAAASRGASHAFAGLDALFARGRPHAVFIRAGSLSVVAFGADGLALGSDGAPVAEVVDGRKLALGLVGDDGALLVALREFLAPLAHRVTFAGLLIRKLLAVFTAGL